MTTPTPTPPPPGPPPVPPAAGSSRLPLILALTAKLAAAGTMFAQANGSITAIVDGFKGADKAGSQITALDERLKLVEADNKAKDRTIQDILRDVRDAVETGKRTGDAAGALEEAQRLVEMRVERMDAQLGFACDKLKIRCGPREGGR